MYDQLTDLARMTFNCPTMSVALAVLKVSAKAAVVTEHFLHLTIANSGWVIANRIRIFFNLL